MARLPKIPDVLVEEMMVKRANGESDQKILSWLKTTHHINCGLSSVNRRLNQVAKERADIAKAIYKDAVANSADQDIKIIDQMVKSLNQEFLKAMSEGDRQG